jgi:hypothetical protein
VTLSPGAPQRVVLSDIGMPSESSHGRATGALSAKARFFVIVGRREVIDAIPRWASLPCRARGGANPRSGVN